MNNESLTEVWQVESNGRVYEAAFEELAVKIGEGSLLRIDRVRKGDLRWIEAGKVPVLADLFNDREAATPTAAAVTTSTTEILGVAEPVHQFDNVRPVPAIALRTSAIHEGTPAHFVCDTCGSEFCKACPNSYGSTVKICPFCGAMCKSFVEEEKGRVEAAVDNGTRSVSFGIGDIGRALAYPFRFKTSLILGGLMFMFFSVGQSAARMGGLFLVAGAITSYMMANTLTFGILANTLENFSQGKLDDNFMPSFDDFSLWDDVVHPFFLSVGVYLSSFGPLAVVLLISMFLLVGSLKSDTVAAATSAVDKELPYAGSAAKQTSEVKDILRKTSQIQQERINSVSDARVPDQSSMVKAEEERSAQLNEIVREQQVRMAAMPVARETGGSGALSISGRLLGNGTFFLILFGLTLIWGLLYFPAACAVAGYTRSFLATLNPAVGLDTIRRLGSSYLIVLLVGLALLAAIAGVGALLDSVLSPFDMPGMGNVAVGALSSLFGFYISVVFSCVLGYALYRAADRLQLYR